MIDTLEMLDLLKRSVKDPDYGPDWVDLNSTFWTKTSSRCRNVYWDEDTGKTRHCIVGHVFFHQLDVGENILVATASSGVVETYQTALNEGFDIEMTENALTMLEYAQGMQDVGVHWGAIVDYIEDHLTDNNKFSTSHTFREAAFSIIGEELEEAGLTMTL